MGRRLRIAGVFFFAAAALAGAAPARPENIDRAVEKMLNPLPEIDPFEKPAESPRFFPDEVDKRARDLMVAALLNHQDAVKEQVGFFKSEDARLQKQHSVTTGLSETAQDLANATIRDRETYLAAQQQALKNATSPERKKYLEAIINHDDLRQSDLLARQSNTNFWGGMMNRMLSSVDLVGVASGNYIGAAVETAISQVYALADGDMSIEERRGLARDLDHLKRYPDDPRNAEIRRRVQTLDKKKMAALARKQLAKSAEAADKKDFENARFHAELAAFFYPDSEAATKALTQAQKSLEARHRNAAEAPNAAAKPKGLPEAQTDVAKLLAALSLRDANQIERLAVELDKKYRGKPLSDAAKDSEAVALEIRGRHEEAKNIITQLARASVTPAAGKHAAALLQSPEYNLLASFHGAQGERRLQTAKYVLLGEDLLRKNLLYAAGAVAVAGPGGAATLGMVNAILLSSNLYNAVTNNPISAQPIIDAGVSYVRSHPNSADSTEIYKILASAYEERGMFERALAYHELAGSSKEKLAAVKEKTTAALLSAAAKAQDRGAREYYLSRLIDEFAGSAAAARSHQKTRRNGQGRKSGLAHEQGIS